MPEATGNGAAPGSSISAGPGGSPASRVPQVNRDRLPRQRVARKPPRHRGLRALLLVVRLLNAVVVTALIGTVLVISGLGVLTASDQIRVRHELTGSMVPLIKVGDLVVYRPSTGAQVRAGDVISFLPPNQQVPVTHRVTAVKPSGTTIVVNTQGDANLVADKDQIVFGSQQVVWSVWKVIPRAGLPISDLSGGNGIPFVLGLMPLFILLPWVKRQLVARIR